MVNVELTPVASSATQRRNEETPIPKYRGFHLANQENQGILSTVQGGEYWPRHLGDTLQGCRLPIPYLPLLFFILSSS